MVGAFAADPLRNTLTDAQGEERHLEPKTMEVLLALVAESDRVVTRQSLIDTIWSAEYSGDEGLTRAISKLRKAFDDARGDPCYIQTVPKRGYRLVADVSGIAPGAAHRDGVRASGKSPILTESARTAKTIAAMQGTNIAITPRLFFANKLSRIGTKSFAPVFLAITAVFLFTSDAQSPIDDTMPPQTEIASAGASVAVLPFKSISPIEDDTYFADGLSEEIMDDLAKIDQLRVVGRMSSFYFKDKPQDLRLTGEQLGVAHILEGSVRRSDEQLRISVRLVDASTGFHLWSETFDRFTDDIFAIQDEIAGRVAIALAGEVIGAEFAQAVDHGTSDAQAQSLYLIARGLVREGQDIATLRTADASVNWIRARRLLEEAVAIDPEFGEAWAALVEVYRKLGGDAVRFTEDHLLPDEAKELMAASLKNAQEFAPNAVATLLAEAAVMWDNRWGDDTGPDLRLARAALAGYEKALSLAPNNFDVLAQFAERLRDVGELQRSIEMFDRALAIDPLAQTRFWKAWGLVVAGEREDARREFLRTGDLYPDWNGWRAGMAYLERRLHHWHHQILWMRSYGENGLSSDWTTLGAPPREPNKARFFDTDLAAADRWQVVIDLLNRRDYASARDMLRTARENDDLFYRPYQMRHLEMAASIFLRDWTHADYLFELNAPHYREEMEGRDSTQRAKNFSTVNKIYVAREAAYRGLVLKNLGREPQAIRAWDWAHEILDDVDPNWSAHRNLDAIHVRALVFAVQNRPEGALYQFEQLYDAGWRRSFGDAQLMFSGTAYVGDYFWFEDTPLIDSIRDHPRFVALAEKVKADNAAMLAELNAGLTLEDIRDEI
ncbi:MAG: hypothetical protein Tsb0010_00910 [Parvularculaceae bacterium]